MQVQTVELATKYVPAHLLADLRGVSYDWLRANLAAGTYPVGRKIGGKWIVEAKDLYDKFGIVVTNAMIDDYKAKRRKA